MNCLSHYYWKAPPPLSDWFMRQYRRYIKAHSVFSDRRRIFSSVALILPVDGWHRQSSGTNKSRFQGDTRQNVRAPQETFRPLRVFEKGRKRAYNENRREEESDSDWILYKFGGAWKACVVQSLFHTSPSSVIRRKRPNSMRLIGCAVGQLCE